MMSGDRKVFTMTVSTGHAYIVRDDQILSGEPIIKGTRTPVRAVVETWRMGIPAEDVVTHLPHLTLAQVFDALSYFADHQDEVMGYIERNRVPEEKIHPAVKNL
jgi:uncharacterized protein (DUF433 family)